MWKTAKRTLGRAILLAIGASCWLTTSAPAAFPGHNGRIAYSAFDAGSRTTRVFTVNADGSARRPISDPSVGDTLDPAWSAEGSRIAYVASITEGPTTVRVMSEDGTGDVAVDETPIDPHDPSWSPDGRRLAWADLVLVNGSPVPAVVTKAVGGQGDPLPLVTKAAGSTIGAVSWSPGGRSIAFTWTHIVCVGENCSPMTELDVIAATGGPETVLVRALPAPTVAERGDIAWSPDGTRLAVSIHGDDLRIVSSTSGLRLATIVPGLGDDEFTRSSGRFVAWSPAGSQIAFVGGLATGSNSASSLVIVPTLGGPASEVPRVSGSEGAIDWQPLQAPVTRITTAPPAVTRARSAQFAFVADKPRVSYQCRLDGRPWATCASGIKYTGLTVGSHAFSVRATELHGVVEERPPRHTWQVVLPPKPSPPQRFPPRTEIRASWFRFTDPHMVVFQSLRAVNVPAGVTIHVRCNGPGCPGNFHRRWRTHRFRASKRVIGGLRDRQLLPHAAVFVTLRKPGYISRGKMYCVRYNRRVRVRGYELDSRRPSCGPTAAS